MSLDGIRNILTPQTGKLGRNEKTEKPQAPIDPNPAQGAQETQKHLTVDMSELEVKAEMNKALGFVKQAPSQETNYAKIDAEFAQNPIAFAEKYASQEVRNAAVTSSVDFDTNATLLRTFTPERQEQVIAGFSQRNESPRAFTGEFLDLFTEGVA